MLLEPKPCHCGYSQLIIQKLLNIDNFCLFTFFHQLRARTMRFTIALVQLVERVQFTLFVLLERIYSQTTGN